MTFEEFQEKFIDWTVNEVEAKKEDGFPVCPYARKARVENKIQFIDASDDVSEIRNFMFKKYEIGIAWLGNDDTNLKAAINTCTFLREFNQNLEYFTSTPDSGHFTKNPSYCVFIQLKDDLHSKRAHLLTTDYYNSWPAEYFKEITGQEKS